MSYWLRWRRQNPNTTSSTASSSGSGRTVVVFLVVLVMASLRNNESTSVQALVIPSRCAVAVVRVPTTRTSTRTPTTRVRCRQARFDDNDNGRTSRWRPQKVSSSSSKPNVSRRREDGTTVRADPRNPRGTAPPNRGRPSRNYQPQQPQESWETTKKERTTTNHNNHQSVHSHYLATCIPGMVPVLMDELYELGCGPVQASGRSAVAFGVPDLTTALQVLLWCRTAHKILELLVDSSDTTAQLLYTRDDLYAFVQHHIPVEDLLWNAQTKEWRTLAVHVTLNNPRNLPSDLSHSHFTALHIKNALVDAARDWHADGLRPSVDTTEQVDVPLYAVVRGVTVSPSSLQPQPAAAAAHCTLYRALHTGSLHRRGYRTDTAIHKAALKESTAAGLLRAAGWHDICAAQRNENHSNNNSSIVLMDPMMGSGTLVVEAAMMAADIAPGLMRLKCGISAPQPPVLRWNHDDDQNVSLLWQELLLNATQRARTGLQRLQQQHDGIFRIVGNDVHGGAVALARRAVQQAGLSAVVELQQGDCADWNPTPDKNTNSSNSSSPQLLVVTNPPWGVRLLESPKAQEPNKEEEEDDDSIKSSWTALKTFVRNQCGPGTEAWILSGNPQATRYLGLRRSQTMPFQTGQQTLRWLQYEIRDNARDLEDDTDDDEDDDPAASPRPNTKRKQPEASVPRSPTPGNSPLPSSMKPFARDTVRPRQRPHKSKSAEVNEWLI